MVEIIYGAQNENHENVIKVQSTHTHTQKQNETQHSERDKEGGEREWEGLYKNVNANAKVNCWQNSRKQSKPHQKCCILCAETAL